MRKLLILMLLTCACGAQQEPEKSVTAKKSAKRAKKARRSARSRAPEAEPMEEEGVMDAPAPAGRAEAKESSAGDAGPATRAWFPETFLFEPSVITDAGGLAEVVTKIPDRLTTWRVLGLAHSQDGGLAGTTTEFVGTLPAYVEPVIPAFLVAGDQVRLPLQVVNTTARPVHGALQVMATGGARVQTKEKVQVPPRGTLLRSVALRATSGTIRLSAGLSGVDAVVHEIPVLPSGKPVTRSHGGTLAEARSVPLTGPANLDPGSTRIRLTVFPGALSVLRSEIARAPGRRGAAADAYALLLAGQMPALAGNVGAKLDEEVLRELRIRTTQRALRHTRAPGTAMAALFTQAAMSHLESPVLRRVGARMVQLLAKEQRPDGSFTEGSGWTVQRVVVVTAEAARAAQAAQEVLSNAKPTPQNVSERLAARSITVRATGALDRFGDDVKDPYTAASILASGAAPKARVAALRALVRDAVEVQEDGSRVLKPPEDVVRPDGRRPTLVEATALAALALKDDPDTPWVSDLGAAVIGAYRPTRGWGDGRTNLLCLGAVMALFKDPIPDSVEVVLELDGKPFASGSMNPSEKMDPLILNHPAPMAAGKHTWTVRSTPAVPGLGYTLELLARVPWPKQKAASGLELAIEVPGQLKVGRPAKISVQAMAPSGVATEVVHMLPAGVQLDEASLKRLVKDKTIRSYEASDGQVILRLAPLAPGVPFQASYEVIPTLAGTLHTQASRIVAKGGRRSVWNLRPTLWVVR